MVFPSEIMITITVQEFNTLSQKYYDQIINELNLYAVKCCCGESGCLSYHGSYERWICSPTPDEPDRRYRLIVQRVKCSVCGHTHALMLSSMVPYSSILLEDQIGILQENKQECTDAEKITGVTEEEKQHCTCEPGISILPVLRRFRKYWKQPLFSMGLSIFSSLSDIIQAAFHKHGLQCMQIIQTRNSLWKVTT